jgi:hypothetical protein
MRKLKAADTIARFARSRRGMQGLSNALRNIVVSGAIVMLAGCAGARPPVSVSDGLCAGVIPRAEYEILGKTRNDQRWIDETIEGEVGGCNYPRPAPRPAAWDVATSSTAPVARPAPTKRPGFLKRTVQKTSMLFHRKPKPSAGSIEPLPKEEPPSRSAAGKLPFDALPWGMKIESPPPIPPAASPPQPEPPPKPRSPVDELLDGPKKPPANSPK